MSEPKKRGRPKKSDTPGNTPSEQASYDFRKDVPPSAPASNHNVKLDEDDDIKSILKNKEAVSETKVFNSNIDEEALKEIEDLDKKRGLNDIPSEDFNPLDEPVMQRTYTGGMNADFVRNYPQEKIIEEPIYNGGGSATLDVDKDLINPNNDIPSGNIDSQPSNPQQQPTNAADGQAKPVEEPDSDNLKNLSNKEKREAVEKTADAILLAYRNYVPLPFIYFSSYDNKKLEQLQRKDELNLDTQVKRDGTTFREYTKIFNHNVEEAFTVTDAEVDALKDPLVDVLMEKEIALTPTQRLLFTAGQLLVAKVMLTVKFLREKKSDIDEMKAIHREKMDAIKAELEREERRGKTNGAKATSAAPPPPPPSEPEKDVSESDAKIVGDSDLSESNPSLDDAINLNDYNAQDDNDIPE